MLKTFVSIVALSLVTACGMHAGGCPCSHGGAVCACAEKGACECKECAHKEPKCKECEDSLKQ